MANSDAESIFSIKAERVINNVNVVPHEVTASQSRPLAVLPGPSLPGLASRSAWLWPLWGVTWERQKRQAGARGLGTEPAGHPAGVHKEECPRYWTTQ